MHCMLSYTLRLNTVNPAIRGFSLQGNIYIYILIETGCYYIRAQNSIPIL